MSVRSGSVDGKDDTIRIAGVCQDHGDHGSKYTIEQSRVEGLELIMSFASVALIASVK